MRCDAVASQALRNASGGLGKPPFGSHNPASRGVEHPRRCSGIARERSPAENSGYGIVWVPYVRYYPLAAGALLTPGKRVKKGVLWAGRPAKLMRKINTDEAARLRQTVENYLNRSRGYLGLDYP